MVLERMLMTRKVHTFAHIVSVVVGSGMLKQVGHLISMLLFAGKIISDDPVLQDWISDQAKSKKHSQQIVDLQVPHVSPLGVVQDSQ